MARPLPPKVRLALPGSESPEVFNFYQIVSLLSGKNPGPNLASTSASVICVAQIVVWH
jgi:hypothetical protein